MKVYNSYIELGVNQIITVFMLSRMYLLIKVFGRFSKYTDQHTVNLCYKYYVEPSVAFSIKAFLKRDPYILTIVCMVAIIAVFGYIVQTFEVGYPTSINYINNYNPFWNVIITITTTGYGDIFPSTHLGRLGAATSMFFGQFIISLILLAMSISAQFTLEEQKAYRSLTDIEYYQKKGNLAAHILTVYALVRICEKQMAKQSELEHQKEKEEASNDLNKGEDDGEKVATKIKKTSHVIKYQRFKDIGYLRAAQRLRVKYDGLVKQFKELTS